MQHFSFNYNGKKFKLEVKKLSFFGKFFGLMFSSREKAKALLFEFNNSEETSIHSLFVFFPFIALWLNKKNEVVGFKKVLPFRLGLSSGKSYSKLLEIPINKNYETFIHSIVGRKI